jgi:hypothetical protein
MYGEVTEPEEVKAPLEALKLNFVVVTLAV